MKALLTALALPAALLMSFAHPAAAGGLEATIEYRAYDREVERSIKAGGELVGYLLACEPPTILNAMLIASQEDYVDGMVLYGPSRVQHMAYTWFDSSMLFGMLEECEPSLYLDYVENALGHAQRASEAGRRLQQMATVVYGLDPSLE